MHKKVFAFVIKLFVTVGLFTFLFRPETFGLAKDFWGEDISLAGLMDALRSVETHHVAFWLTFAAIVRLCGLFCGVLRWRLLLLGQGLRVPFWYMVQSWFVGRAIGIVLPGTIGLDGYRLYDSARYTGEVIKSTTVIIVEKLIGFIALSFLVFVTFPLGFRLLHLSVPVGRLVIPMALGSMVLAALLVLLNPRVIQVAVAVAPWPTPVRNLLNKIGAAVTAYSGNRKSLLLAVLFGIIVHAAACVMFFGVTMAIRAENTTIFDILFTSPLMIWGTVLGPSVGGEGIREIVFTTILGAKSGTVKAFLIGHLGWWVGDVVPFLIGLGVFLFRSRPSKTELHARLAEARQAGLGTQSIQLTPQETAWYRGSLADCAMAGLAGGLIGGALVGLAEAVWLAATLRGGDELQVLWWAPLGYGLVFVLLGLTVAAGLAFLFLLRDRFLRPHLTFALCLGLVVSVSGFVIGRFRFNRDVLDEHGLTLMQTLTVAFASVGLGAILTVVVGGVLSLLIEIMARGLGYTPPASGLFTRKEQVGGFDKPLARGLGGALIAFALLVASGFIAARAAAPSSPSHVFSPSSRTSGPNVFLIVADALRADGLPMYSPDAVARTPNLDAFAKDAVKFEATFAQASWTKPSFGVLFSGLYPEAHTATGKSQMLPDTVTTLAELLTEGGYFTKGLANNPNITVNYNFQQGFADYVDLRPNLYFGAMPSASRTVLYGLLRRLGQVFNRRLHGDRIEITDFYQPAEVVTRTALDWLDSPQRPQGSPFFLFLHYMETHDPFMDWEQPGIGYGRVRMHHPDPQKYLEPMKKAYASEIEHLDRHLGDLFTGLRQRGLYHNALIVFVSDHGEEFYDHGGWWHGQTLYDELLHVPLVIKLPGNTAGGTSVAHLARHTDVAPTVLAFAGIEQPAAMCGRPLLTPDGAPASTDVLYTYAANDLEGNILQAVRSTEVKLIRANPDNPRNLAPAEFYDLRQDPKEKNNLAGQNDPSEANLQKVLDDMQAFIKLNAAEPVLLQGTPKELKEQLEALGYLGG